MIEYLVIVPYTSECCVHPHAFAVRVMAEDEDKAGAAALRYAKLRHFEAEEYMAFTMTEIEEIPFVDELLDDEQGEDPDEE